MLDASNFDTGHEKTPNRLGAIILVVFLTCAIVYLAIQIWDQVQMLTSARSDVVQWSLSQAEVEHRTYVIAGLHALRNPEGQLDELRKRFDTFYNRIDMMKIGKVFAEFRNDPEFEKNLLQIDAYLQNTEALVDGSNAEVIENLPEIVAGAEAIYPNVRAITHFGVTHFAALYTENRRALLVTFSYIAAFTGLLLVAFMFMIRALDRLNKQNRHKAWLNNISRARMSAIVSTSLDAIIVTRTDSRITEFNGAAERIFGQKPGDVIGKSILSLIEIPDAQSSDDMCMEAFLTSCSEQSGDRERIRVIGHRKSGEIFPAELSIGSVEGTEGTVFVSYIRDISKELNAENELRKARDSAIAGEKSKANLLAVMSHEMRTPLNGMLGTIELLGDSELRPSQQEYLRIIRQSGELLMSHVNDVLDISRLDAGKLDLDITSFDLGSLIRDLLDAQSVLARERGNTMTVSFDSDEPVIVRSDHLRLRQILLNLIGNANKFTEGGGISVEVETSDIGPMVEIRVIDSGIGIAPSEIEHIFADFTTLDATYGRKTGGTGLGLGIARRVARAMNGDITAESVLGEGSMFTLRLPILADVQTQDPGPAPQPMTETAEEFEERLSTSPASFETLRILVVEDNEINRIVAHDFLVLDDHDVSVAEDGATGLAIAQEQKFDVILMDISMPDLDGTEVTRRIKSGNGPNRDTPIFALTAHAMEEDIKRFQAAGMKRAIIKPITRKVLRQALFDIACGPVSDDGQKRPLLDANILSEFREEIGEERFEMLFGRFVNEMDLALDALTGEDVESIAMRAHKMSGSASMFGAQRMCCALRKLETAAKSENDVEVERLKGLVDEVWAKTRHNFEAHLMESVHPGSMTGSDTPSETAQSAERL